MSLNGHPASVFVDKDSLSEIVECQLNARITNSGFHRFNASNDTA
jgi:hypothetical protein